MHQVQADVAFLDRLERIALAALPAALTAEMWAHNYLSTVNEITASRSPHRIFGDNENATIYGLGDRFTGVYPCTPAQGSHPRPAGERPIWHLEVSAPRRRRLHRQPQPGLAEAGHRRRLRLATARERHCGGPAAPAQRHHAGPRRRRRARGGGLARSGRWPGCPSPPRCPRR